MVLSEDKAAQFRPEMAGDAGWQWRCHDLAARCQPTLTVEIHDVRVDLAQLPAISNGTGGFVLGSDAISNSHITFAQAGITDNTAFDYFATCLNVPSSWSPNRGRFTIPQIAR